MLITNTILVFETIRYFYRFYRFFAKFELRGWELAQGGNRAWGFRIQYWFSGLSITFIDFIDFFAKFELGGWELAQGGNRAC